MKKKILALAAVCVLSVAMVAAGCTNGDTNDTDNGSKDDTYVDYDPSKQPGGDQFDYDGNYAEPELTIDGKGDEEQWQNLEPLVTYGKQVDDGQGGQEDAVSVKIFRGENALFLLFEVKDTVLLTNGTTNDDAVTHGDSVEFYIDTQADGGKRPQSDDFQINLGIHGKTRIMQGAGTSWGSWNGLIDYEVQLNDGSTLNDGTQANDTGYTVEVMVQYKDIMIEKSDVVAIAFGQVDKVDTPDAASGSETGPWNWYGWTYKGEAVDPQIPETYIMLDQNGKLFSRNEVAMPEADVAGTVTDGTGAPVANAAVKTTVDGEETIVYTDANGYFVFDDVDPEQNYTVVIEKEGYITATAVYTREELRAANGAVVLKDFTLYSSAELSYTTLGGTVKNVANGAVGGATVTLKNTTLSAETDADGSFTLENVPANIGDVVIVVERSGYVSTETVIKEEALVEDGVTALGDVNLNLPAGETGEFGILANLAYNSGYITRTLTGVEFRFEGLYTFNGWIELFIDTKTAASVRDASNVLYKFHADGSTAVENYGGGNFTTDGIVWSVEVLADGGYTAKAFIPYTTLGIEACEPFGISLGQNNGALWDGWNRSDMVGTNGLVYVAPEIPTDYVRVGAKNNLYEASHNIPLVTFGGTVTFEEEGLEGVTVTIGSLSATTNAAGEWSLSVPVTGDGVSVVYTKAGYVAQTTAISAGELSGAESWSDAVVLTLQKVTLTGVIHDQDDNPIEGVTVTLTVGDEIKTVSTNAEGAYSFENVPTFVGVTVAFEKEGYAAIAATSIAQKDLAAAENNEYRLNKNLTQNDQVRYISVTGSVVGIDGALGNVSVSVDGKDLAATTDADGTFVLSQFACVESTITLTLNGYISQTVSFREEDADDGDSYSLGEIFLARDYVRIGNAFGTKDDLYAGFVPYVTRGEDGFLFKFEGENAFTGHIELFVDTKLSSGLERRDTTDYRFDLFADGRVTAVNYGDAAVDTQTLVLKVTGAGGASPAVEFTLPYAVLGVERSEIVGVSFGQANSAGGWDGWNWNDDVKGVDGLAYVDPAITWDYVRIGADNQAFWNAENKALDEFDFTSYNLHFGSGLDSFHAKISRDESGITFSFAANSEFGRSTNTSSGATDSTEVILVYLDVDSTASAGWNNDCLLKITGDGNVYLAGQPWYAVSDANKIGTVDINVQNGVTTISYKLDYSKIGINESTVFGVSMVEGWLTEADNNAPYGNYYGGFLVTLDSQSHTVGDAADEAQFIRVKKDGSLVIANSNANVSE